jgi:hypothetical protein
VAQANRNAAGNSWSCLARPKLAFIGLSPHQAIAFYIKPGLKALLDRSTDRFAASSLSALHLTCDKLIETHHWCSLVMQMSNFFQFDTWRRPFGFSLDDPLGLTRLSSGTIDRSNLIRITTEQSCSSA